MTIPNIYYECIWNWPLQITPAVLCKGQVFSVDISSGIPKMSKQSKMDSSNPLQSTLVNIADTCSVDEEMLL